jgi:hypothetical protein
MVTSWCEVAQLINVRARIIGWPSSLSSKKSRLLNSQMESSWYPVQIEFIEQEEISRFGFLCSFIGNEMDKLSEKILHSSAFLNSMIWIFQNDIIFI